MTHVADEAKLNKFFRFSHGLSGRALKGSLDVEHFTAVVQVLLDKGARANNLLEYVSRGCPLVDFAKAMPKARGRKSKGVAPADTTHLRYLESVELSSTDGTTTIASAGDVFTGWLDSDFREWGTSVSSADTAPATALIYEMKEDGTFLSLFSSLGDGWLSRMPTQGQIVAFCIEHRGKLRQDGYGNFFPFRVEGKSEPFVARVNLVAGLL